MNEKGQVYDETKYAWLQGRQVWTYCFLYQNHERFRREDMKAAAIKGGEFLLNHFKDQNSDKIYFMTSREGLPLKHQRTLFTEVFFCMAMSGLYQITKEKKYFIEATEIFQKIHQWARFDESGLGKLPNLPKVSTLANAFCLLSLIHEMEDIGAEDIIKIEEIANWCVDDIFKHVQRNGTRILETVSVDGKELPNSAAGRVLNPGHSIECGWFLLKEAKRIDNPELKDKAIKHFIEYPLEYGTDKEEGGLFYFLDVDGNDPIQLEWDMKLWWAHLETMIALIMAYEVTKDEKHWNAFVDIAEYSFDKFSDPVHGEWYGYLSRNGEPKMNWKGGSFKGCFHLPRALSIIERILTKLIQNHEN